MSSNSVSNSKSVLIENDNKSNSEKSGVKGYGSINETSNESNINDQNNNSGWLSKATYGVYNVGAGAVGYGLGGIKWALSSTASVGTSVLSAGAGGIVQLKRKTSKDKNE